MVSLNHLYVTVQHFEDKNESPGVFCVQIMPLFPPDIRVQLLSSRISDVPTPKYGTGRTVFSSGACTHVSASVINIKYRFIRKHTEIDLADLYLRVIQ